MLEDVAQHIVRGVIENSKAQLIIEERVLNKVAFEVERSTINLLTEDNVQKLPVLELDAVVEWELPRSESFVSWYKDAGRSNIRRVAMEGPGIPIDWTVPESVFCPCCGGSEPQAEDKQLLKFLREASRYDADYESFVAGYRSDRSSSSASESREPSRVVVQTVSQAETTSRSSGPVFNQVVATGLGVVAGNVAASGAVERLNDIDLSGLTLPTLTRPHQS